MKQQNNQQPDLENRNAQEESENTFGQLLRATLDGSFLTSEKLYNRFPLILLVVVLAVLYIANTYHAEALLREYKDLENEVRELSTEAISISSQLMQTTNQSAIGNLCKEKGLGLHENLEPPYKVILKKKDLEIITAKEIKK